MGIRLFITLVLLVVLFFRKSQIWSHPQSLIGKSIAKSANKQAHWGPDTYYHQHLLPRKGHIIDSPVLLLPLDQRIIQAVRDLRRALAQVRSAVSPNQLRAFFSWILDKAQPAKPACCTASLSSRSKSFSFWRSSLCLSAHHPFYLHSILSPADCIQVSWIHFWQVLGSVSFMRWLCSVCPSLALWPAWWEHSIATEWLR